MKEPTSQTFLFGPAGNDKIKRLKAGVTKDFRAGQARLTELKQMLEKNRKKRATMTGYKRIHEWMQLDRAHERIQKQVKDIESGEEYKRYMEDMDVINQANAEEVALQEALQKKQAADNKPIRDLSDVMNAHEIASAVARCKDAFVRCKRLGIFTKEMSIPSFINRDYCGGCNMPFLQLSETKVVCKNCGCVEGNTEVPISILSDEAPLSYDRRGYFEAVLDLFHEKPDLPEMPQIANEIMTEIWLDRTRTEAKATGASVKKHLERIGKTRYTKYCNQIANYINNETVPIITAEMEFKSLLFFVDLQIPFAELCKTLGKSSFPNYHLLFRIMCLIFGWKQFIPYLTMLRTEEKKDEQMQLIKLMFADRGYPWPSEDELSM